MAYAKRVNELASEYYGELKERVRRLERLDKRVSQIEERNHEDAVKEEKTYAHVEDLENRMRALELDACGFHGGPKELREHLDAAHKRIDELMPQMNKLAAELDAVTTRAADDVKHWIHQLNVTKDERDKAVRRANDTEKERAELQELHSTAMSRLRRLVVAFREVATPLGRLLEIVKEAEVSL